MHDHAVADLRADERPGQEAVVGPGRRRPAGDEREIGEPGLQVDLDDAGSGLRSWAAATRIPSSHPGGWPGAWPPPSSHPPAWLPPPHPATSPRQSIPNTPRLAGRPSLPPRASSYGHRKHGPCRSGRGGDGGFRRAAAKILRKTSRDAHPPHLRDRCPAHNHASRLRPAPACYDRSMTSAPSLHGFRNFSRHEYEKMIDAGILREDEHVEPWPAASSR